MIMNMHKSTWFTLATGIFLAQAVPGFAQQQGGWRKIGEPGQAQPQAEAPPLDQQPQAAPQQSSGSSQLNLPAGTWITVRVNQPLSSDHNQPGDAFTATLEQPLIAEGRVIARRGQTVAGRVADVQKGGRVKGTSRLSIELTELSIVDGQQIPIRTQLAERQAGTSNGRDAGAIAAGTGVGAAIGAAADGGFGAGMGAIAGAAASTIGVLVTRGNNTVVYPEQVLTFRLEAPILISTARSEQAFQYVTQEAYDGQRGNYSYRGAPQQAAVIPAPYYSRYYPYSPYGYYPSYPGYYAPYFGTSLFFYSGPRYYSRPGFGRGYGYGYYGRGGGYRRR